MRCPFPGMDPYLENPALWPDVHNRLIAAIADDLGPRVAPDYYVRLERRTYYLTADDLVLVGRPDISILGDNPPETKSQLPLATVGVVEVIVPSVDEVGESYLEVHEVATGRVITVLELLSPANKFYAPGRKEYEEKRRHIFRSRTNLIEIDLLRGGRSMPWEGKQVQSDYRIFVSRASKRPRADLYPFNLRQPIPKFDVPLQPGDKEPALDLTAILHALYDRARYDLSLDYSRSPVPPLGEEDAAWARELLATQ